MTVIESRELLVEQRCVDVPTILDTTELRWFVPGQLPDDVGQWFRGAAGVREERCDTYQLSGRCDVGVKRRFRTTIELKVRQVAPVPMQLADGLSGSLEEWRKWSPAGRLVANGTEGVWVDVEKSIVKRRFSTDGTEITGMSTTPLAGCDVEVTRVAVGAVEAWTVALAAFGQFSTRRESLLASWRTLTAAASGPGGLLPGAGASMGYPEWLASAVSLNRSDRSAQRRMELSR